MSERTLHVYNTHLSCGLPNFVLTVKTNSVKDAVKQAIEKFPGLEKYKPLLLVLEKRYKDMSNDERTKVESRCAKMLKVSRDKIMASVE